MKTITLPDGSTLTYFLERKAVKNINMRVGADGLIYVSAGRHIKVEEIETALTKHREFFRKAAKRMAERNLPSRRTDVLRWLGEDYKIVPLRNSREEVLCENGELRVFTLLSDPADILRMTEKWRAARFVELCRELNNEVRSALFAHELNPPATVVTVKEMKSRWGSCSYYRGHISINYRLAEYPRETILSVFWHEYAHYWHHDHSDKFYSFLEQHYPEYKKWNNLLKQR